MKLLAREGNTSKSKYLVEIQKLLILCMEIVEVSYYNFNDKFPRFRFRIFQRNFKLDLLDLLAGGPNGEVIALVTFLLSEMFDSL